MTILQYSLVFLTRLQLEPGLVRGVGPLRVILVVMKLLWKINYQQFLLTTTENEFVPGGISFPE